ncbi:MAG TPA: FtsX-like permease family protein [Patescibacteria group bacterium]|nr:FtsX-like permease family protein [Patescibacteria group bacterium]
MSWKLAFLYARRELRAGLSGFYVFLLCLVLGVGAIAAIQSLSRGLADSLMHDGRSILGGDIEIRTLYKPAGDDALRWLEENLGPVSTVLETRGMARRGDEGKSVLAEIKAVDKAYPLYGQPKLLDAAGQSLTTPLQELLARDGDIFGAIAEKEALSRLDVKIGDNLKIGGLTVVVRGVIDTLPDTVGGALFTIAPRIVFSREAFAETGLGGAGSSLTFRHRVATREGGSEGHFDRLEERLEKQFSAEKWRIRNFYHASPRLERYIERLTFFLTLIGLTTLLVGGTGISNAVRAYLDTKLANIATLKCLGAPAQFIFRVYLLQVIALSLIGITAGAALGTLGARIAGALLTAKLSFSDAVGFYPDAIALSALFGLLATLAFSLWPIGRAVKVTPNDLFRDAIAHKTGRPAAGVMAGIALSALALAALGVMSAPDHRMALWFAGGTILTFLVFLSCAGGVKSGLKKIKLPARPEARMALANLYRPGNVTTGAVLSLGLGLTVLVAVALVEYNFSRLLREDLAADAPSFFFLDIQPDQVADFRRAMDAFPGDQHLQITPSLRGRITLVNGVDAVKALKDKTHDWVVNSDRGFTYAAAQPGHSTIIKGKWWPADYKGPPLISISTDVAEAFAIGVGDKLSVDIMGEEITAEVANVRDIEWASFTMNFAVTFAPGALDEMPASAVSTVVVDERDEEPLQAQLAKEFPNVTAIRVREALDTAGTVITGIAQAVRIAAAVTLAAGALVLAGGMAASRRRHVYDAVVLKVLGATRARIAKTFVLEYGILGFVTVSIAAVIGTGAAWAVLRFIMHLPWKFSLLSLLYVAAACLALTLGAGFFGTWQALRHKPAPWLRNP